MSDAQLHSGSCHCGHVRFEVETDLKTVISCNCSICTKSGILWTFAPAEAFRLISGGDDLVEYQFNNHVIRHLHCPRCGVESFARGKSPDGKDTAAINARCLDDVDIATLQLMPFDGRSR